MKEYRLTKRRLFVFWIAPVILTALIYFIAYSDYKTAVGFPIGKVIGYSLVFAFSVVTFIVIFFNHYSTALQTVLYFEEGTIQIQQFDKKYQFRLDEILEVTEYSVHNKYTEGRLPWSDVYKWRLKTADIEIDIPSLIISRKNLKKHINNNITYKFTYFPLI